MKIKFYPMKALLKVLGGIILCMSIFQCSPQKNHLKTVDDVDLSRYIGKWYEIASFPQSFQKNCFGTSAEYSINPDGVIIVENRCNKGGVDGKEAYIKGKAFVVPNSGNAKLKVQFFRPFKGDYWIIDLADDYSYAAVGSPNMKYLWILSRKPNMDSSIYQDILLRLTSLGFDIQKLKKTTHKS